MIEQELEKASKIPGKEQVILTPQQTAHQITQLIKHCQRQHHLSSVRLTHHVLPTSNTEAIARSR